MPLGQPSPVKKHSQKIITDASARKGGSGGNTGSSLPPQIPAAHAEEQVTGSSGDLLTPRPRKLQKAQEVALVVVLRDLKASCDHQVLRLMGSRSSSPAKDHERKLPWASRSPKPASRTLKPLSMPSIDDDELSSLQNVFLSKSPIALRGALSASPTTPPPQPTAALELT